MTNPTKPYDIGLYATRTTKLREIAKREGADLLIRQKNDVVYEVGSEKTTEEREALIIAIERKRKGGEK